MKTTATAFPGPPQRRRCRRPGRRPTGRQKRWNLTELPPPTDANDHQWPTAATDSGTNTGKSPEGAAA